MKAKGVNTEAAINRVTMATENLGPILLINRVVINLLNSLIVLTLCQRWVIAVLSTPTETNAH